MSVATVVGDVPPPAPGPCGTWAAARCPGSALPRRGSGAAGAPVQPATASPQPGPPGPDVPMAEKRPEALRPGPEAGEEAEPLQQVEVEPGTCDNASPWELLRDKYQVLSPCPEATARQPSAEAEPC